MDSKDNKMSRVAVIMLRGFDVLFLLSLVVLPLAWFWDPFSITWQSIPLLRVSWGAKPLIAPFVFLFLRLFAKRFVAEAYPGRKGLLENNILKKGVLVLASLYLTVGLLEWCLSIVGFELEMSPVVFSVKDDTGKQEEQKGYSDPELIFKFRMGESYNGVPINSLGFREREVDPVKPDGTMRVICMGDSCTAQGNPSYSGYLHEKLTDNPLSENSWEAFNMAVYGYSSLQGLRVFQKQGKHLQPDVVTVYFGWNDHWLHMQSDRSRMAARMTKRQARYYSRFKKKRVFMLYQTLVKPNQRFATKRKEAAPRVPHEEYRAVLRAFVDEIRAVGATPLLITAPRRDVDYDQHHAEHPDVDIDFNVIHDEYVTITREVGDALDVAILDLHRRFSDPEYDSLFSKDGIHFTDAGLRHIADALYAKLEDMCENGRISVGP